MSFRGQYDSGANRAEEHVPVTNCTFPSAATTIPEALSVITHATKIPSKKVTATLVAANTLSLFPTTSIPQSQEYHDFADQRTLFFGIPNTLDVVSNLPFLVVGVVGLVLCYHGNYFKLSLEGELLGWTFFFAGVAAVAFGSSYYHLEPNDERLVWDRLPMTVAFTSIVAIFIIERIDEKTGSASIIPLIIAGVISILYWRFFDDLRPYALVQFIPCVAIPIVAILVPPTYTHSVYWLWAAVFYLLAKVLEAEDKLVYKWTHNIVSGHTLKHLSAAMVPVFLTLMLAKRTIEPERKSLLEVWRVSWIRVKETRFNKSNPNHEYSTISTNTTTTQVT